MAEIEQVLTAINDNQKTIMGMVDRVATLAAPGADKTPAWHRYAIIFNGIVAAMIPVYLAIHPSAPTVTSDVTVTTPPAASAPANTPAPGSPGPAPSPAPAPSPVTVMGPTAPALKPAAPDPYRPTTPLGKAALAYRDALPAALRAMEGKAASEAATAYRAAADPFEAALSAAVAPDAPKGSFGDAEKVLASPSTTKDVTP